jgi:hypothetical protein
MHRFKHFLISSLLIIFFLSSCGYKADPVYEPSKEEINDYNNTKGDKK